MKTVDEIKFRTHERSRAQRNIYLAVHGEKFEYAFTHASDIEKKQLVEAIDAIDIAKLHSIVKKIIFQDKSLEYYTSRELKRLAKDYGLDGYMWLPKANLLSRIVSHEQSLRTLASNGTALEVCESASKPLSQVQTANGAV